MKIELLNSAVVGGELALAWGDGLESYLGMELLRRSCPCASCQGEPDALGRVQRPQVTLGPGSTELRNFEGVGGYALRLYWGDGHSTGIYTYAYLRSLGGSES
ncbi:MAG: DUF971 domain-containing protein [Verrucomicrobia bacterium]|nr:DUF971 domain-containing protein [Verrucomicrobiota bacterium]